MNRSALLCRHIRNHRLSHTINQVHQLNAIRHNHSQAINLPFRYTHTRTNTKYTPYNIILSLITSSIIIYTLTHNQPIVYCDNNQSNNQHNNSVTSHQTKRWFYYSGQMDIDEVGDDIRLISGSANKQLSEQISSLLGVPLCPTKLGSFSDGETQIQILDNIRDRHVFIIQPTTTSDTLMELLLLISTCRRASARKITAVIPYYGYSRQVCKSTFLYRLS